MTPNYKVLPFLLLEDSCFTVLWWSLPYLSSNSHNYIYISLPSGASLSLLFHPSGSSQNARLGSLYHTVASCQLAVLHMVAYACQSYFLSLSYLLPPLLCLPDHPLLLHLHFFFVMRFISIIFLDSIYMH